MNKMIVSTFELLSADILFEIFDYLSAVDVLQSFLLLNKRFSNIVRHEYLWNIHIGDSTMSLSMFTDLCQNALKVASLRVTLTNAINGWSLISSSLKYQTALLQRLHLIDIKPPEFDYLLRDHLIKQLDTLIVDVTPSNPFNYLDVEGVYLTKVCSQLPRLTNCRLPFNVYHGDPYKLYQLHKSSAIPIISLPNLLNTTHLRRLSIGMSTSHFLQCLLSCIPFIENLSVGINDLPPESEDSFDVNQLPVAVDVHLLLYLSRLHINCKNSYSFYRTTALLSSVFGQLSHLSLKLKASMVISSPLIISGDIIQQLCIDRLKPQAAYDLNLALDVKHDLEEKIIFNSFFQAPFTNRQKPKVFIQECGHYYLGDIYHCVMVFTSPRNNRVLPTYLFSGDLEQSYPLSINEVDLFPRTNELWLTDFKKKNCVSELRNFRSSESLLVPWSLLTKISIVTSVIVTAAELKSILRMAYNVHTLEIRGDIDIFLDAILHNTDHLGTRVNQQVQTIEMNNDTLTLENAQRLCRLLSNQLPNLKKVSLSIYIPYDNWEWKPSRIVDCENEFIKHILNVIYFLVDHLQQLVSLYIEYNSLAYCETRRFRRLILKQLNQHPLNRPYRLRCNREMIQIWL